MSKISGVQPSYTQTDSVSAGTEGKTRTTVQTTSEVAAGSAGTKAGIETGNTGEKKGVAAGTMARCAADNVNDTLKETHTSVRFKYHENLNRISIKIVDEDTDEVIKEIPPEETLEMVEKMLQQAGLIVDKRC